MLKSKKKSNSTNTAPCSTTVYHLDYNLQDIVIEIKKLDLLDRSYV